jgi:hypothetical protein
MTSPADGHMTSMTRMIQEIILQDLLLILISEGGLAMLKGQWRLLGWTPPLVKKRRSKTWKSSRQGREGRTGAAVVKNLLSRSSALLAVILLGRFWGTRIRIWPKETMTGQL